MLENHRIGVQYREDSRNNAELSNSTSHGRLQVPFLECEALSMGHYGKESKQGSNDNLNPNSSLFRRITPFQIVPFDGAQFP
ncbi:unnamed protein product [Chondrus crispus]|uniref:Uncharacterized protein n=1 Tax=Chondrus crispus TaxID=2769 RepID=R7QCT5_CHOCR|nr:unnamed protein product [Chondrus crispus]CDF35246.1 unnamed protein product [Chondrus crispus]|eukprot:XP_005715065.1 unnamed protein product [Chondrus crispus]